MPTPLAAQHLYDCRGYPSRGVVRDIALRVEAMRRLERETADRLVGLDTRPYAWLLEQARKAAIGDCRCQRCWRPRDR